MRYQIDVNALPNEVIRPFLVHSDQAFNALTGCNNKLLQRLHEARKDWPPAIANQLADILNEWSKACNALTEASQAEIERIIRGGETMQ